MPPQQPQLDINQLRSNPDFQGLAPGDQHKVLTKAFPDYAALPGQEQGAVMDHLTRRDQPAGLPSGSALPGFPAPPNPMAKNIAWYDPMNQPKSSTPDIDPNTTPNPTSGTGFMGAASKDASSAYHQAIDFANEPVGEKAKRVGGSLLGAIPAALRGGQDMLRRQSEDQARAVAESAQGHPLSALKNTALSYIEPASELLGGDPDDARQRYKNGDVGGAAWELLGKPAALTAASELGARAVTGAQDLLLGAPKPAKAVSSLATLIGPGIRDEAPEVVAAQIRPLAKQAADAIGLKDEDFLGRHFTGDIPSRGPGFLADKDGLRRTVAGMDKGRQLGDKMVEIADKPMNTVADKAKDQVMKPEVTQKIAADMRQRAAAAADVGNDQLEKAYNTLADRVETKKTFGDLNDLKKNANKQFEGSSEIDEAVKPVQAWRDVAGSIRQNMYPELQQYIPPEGEPGHFDLGDMGRRESMAIQSRDGIYQSYKQAADLNSSFGAKSTGERIGEGSAYKQHIAKKILHVEPTPAGKFNNYLRKAVGEVGAGAVPESTSVVPRGMQPRLPAPPGYAQFDVPTPGAPETTQGSAIVGSQRHYLGTEPAPNPGYQPITGPSWVQQHQELGSIADTIPNSARGVQSPARVRADQLGLGHDPNVGRGGLPPPPTRSITGDPTINQSKWHFVSAPNEATQTVDRGTQGIFRTNDPVQAQTALDAMDKHMQTDSFKNLDKQTQFETRAAAEKLRNQLESHLKVKNSPRPPEFEVHWDPGNPAKLRGRRTGAGLRIAAGSVRSLIQSAPGQLTPPPYSQQDVDSEQQLMSQPQ